MHISWRPCQVPSCRQWVIHTCTEYKDYQLSVHVQWMMIFIYNTSIISCRHMAEQRHILHQNINKYPWDGVYHFHHSVYRWAITNPWDGPYQVYQVIVNPMKFRAHPNRFQITWVLTKHILQSSGFTLSYRLNLECNYSPAAALAFNAARLRRIVASALFSDGRTALSALFGKICLWNQSVLPLHFIDK